VRRVSSLGGESGIEIGGAIGIDLMLAVRLVLVLALAALQARPDLSTDTDSLADLGESDFGTDTHDLADDFVSNGQRVRAVAPVTADGVTVTGADAAAFSLDVDVVVAKGSGLP
jgi:hypothetical protein